MTLTLATMAKVKIMPLDPWSYAEKTGTEHAHQTALFMWANMACNFGLLQANDKESYKLSGYAKRNYEERGGPLMPQLKWLHAIHNQGHGDAIRGGKARAEGVKAGVFDCFLPCAARISVYNAYYHGLYLELKVGKNKPSEKQLEFMADMREGGYAAEVAYGWLDARDKILAYLGFTNAD